MNEYNKTIKQKLIEAEATRDLMIKRLVIITDDINRYKEILRSSESEGSNEV